MCYSSLLAICGFQIPARSTDFIMDNGAILAPISCITPSIPRDGDDGGSDGGGGGDDDETTEATMAEAATTTSPNLPGNLAGGSGAG